MPTRSLLSRPVAGGLYWLGVGMALVLPVQAVDETVPAPPNENAEAPAASPAAARKTPVPSNEGVVIPFSPNGNPELPAPPAEGAVIPFAPQEPPTPEPTAVPAQDPPPPAKPATDLESAWDDITHQRAFSNTAGGYAYAAGGFGSRPSGFAENAASAPMTSGFADDLLDGFDLSATLSGTYDSNPSMGYAPVGATTGGDFFTTLGGTANYLSKSKPWTFGATYTGSYSEYFSQSELSGYNQSSGASVNYAGGPLSATLHLGLGIGSGANRYYGAVTNQISLNYGLSARYRISRKTSLTANISENSTTASGSQSNNTSSFTLGTAAMWQYSPLTEFGPGISYRSTSGGSRQSLMSIGPTLNTNYKLSRKVSLSSQVGLNFSQYQNGQSADPTVSASIALNYQASRLWGMNLALNRNVQADPTYAGTFSEMTSFRVGYNRKIRRATWVLGASYEMTSYMSPNGMVQNLPDRDYLRFNSSLSMPVFANTCNASVFASYSDQSGASSANSWDSIQLGFSLSRKF